MAEYRKAMMEQTGEIKRAQLGVESQKAQQLREQKEKELEQKEKEFQERIRQFNENLKVKKQKASGVGKPAKPATVDEKNAAGFARRMEQSEQIFKDIASTGETFSGWTAQAQRMLPDILSPLKGEKLQLQEQAERNFINAVLRRESGAAISSGEFSNAEMQYFPRPGDTDAVRAQKAANRQQAIESLKMAAGSAYAATPFVSPPKIGAPKAAGPKIGEVVKGYKFIGGDPGKKESWEKVK
jgi:hypothetical protein